MFPFGWSVFSFIRKSIENNVSVPVFSWCIVKSFRCWSQWFVPRKLVWTTTHTENTFHAALLYDDFVKNSKGRSKSVHFVPFVSLTRSHTRPPALLTVFFVVVAVASYLARSFRLLAAIVCTANDLNRCERASEWIERKCLYVCMWALSLVIVLFP